ncbi:hypothetical protein [Roseomonas sp. CECT 9278]|uniref:hypothetical protein n=1 Tax=Roseomonas sp. CECT 9278 TaxID=2845823 RepID=UPI001E3E467D|nr:hypothetical protein [Roseomonas sp. CECT 9278]
MESTFPDTVPEGLEPGQAGAQSYPQMTCIEWVIHDHFGAQTTITLGQRGTITLGRKPIDSDSYRFL